ncbi:MAG: TIGR02757 family protein [Bacteroidota bacterium]
MASPSPDGLQTLLDERFIRYNQPDFILEDPISIPHRFSRKEDIEISGFLIALLAWGRRPMIIRSGERLLAIMEDQPYEWVMGKRPISTPFVHRTFNGEDLAAMRVALRKVYQQEGGLETIFTQGIKPSDPDVYGGLIHARTCLTTDTDFPARSHKHLANPAKGSAAKRINMFLRWMVRNDGMGVDFGLWKGISPSQLICPLDVHTATVARRLGLLTRKQNDWKAASELTASLRSFCPEDPVRYDFSLFGMGAYEGKPD